MERFYSFKKKFRFEKGGGGHYAIVFLNGNELEHTPFFNTAEELDTYLDDTYWGV